jgi:hypothetical protein
MEDDACVAAIDARVVEIDRQREKLLALRRAVAGPKPRKPKA